MRQFPWLSTPGVLLFIAAAALALFLLVTPERSELLRASGGGGGGGSKSGGSGGEEEAALHAEVARLRAALDSCPGAASSEVAALRADVARLRSALGTLSCECKNVGPTGGFCLQPGDGADGVGVGGNALINAELARELGKLFDGASVADFGAGMGQYEAWWDGARARGEPAPASVRACDGAENIEAVGPRTAAGAPVVAFCDLSQPVHAEPADWVLSLEVGEHIPTQFEAAFVGNLMRHARKGAVISWAVPGQPGHFHVNLKDKAAVLSLFGAAWALDEELTAKLRTVGGALTTPWFADTIYALRRVSE